MGTKGAATWPPPHLTPSTQCTKRSEALRALGKTTRHAYNSCLSWRESTQFSEYTVMGTLKNVLILVKPCFGEKNTTFWSNNFIKMNKFYFIDAKMLFRMISITVCINHMCTPWTHHSIQGRLHAHFQSNDDSFDKTLVIYFVIFIYWLLYNITIE